MTVNDIIGDARNARARELKTALAEAKARLAEAEAARDALLSHFDLALAALHDFERLGPDGSFRIIDGWNVLLHCRNVSKLSSEEISKLKADYLASLGIVPHPSPLTSHPSPLTSRPPPLTSHPSPLIWLIFDGPEENSYVSGAYRVTYTGGTGPQRADRLILDYVHAARLLGLDVSRLCVETADKTLMKKVEALGAKVSPPCFQING